jgi:hypothetical protein
MERLLSRFMIGYRLFCFATSELLSLSGIDRDQCFSRRRSFLFRLQPQPGGFFFCFFRARRMLTGEPFNPTFFATAANRTEQSIAARSVFEGEEE